VSLINKMLRDLDRRHASQGGMEATAPGRLAEEVRPVSGWGMGSDLFWRAAAVLGLLALGGIAWMTWQSMHRPADASLRSEFPGGSMSARKEGTPPPTAPASRPEVALAAVSPAVPVPVVAVPQPTVAVPAAIPPREPVKIETPGPAPASATLVPERVRKPASSRSRSARPRNVAQATPVQTAPARTASDGEPADSGKIDRRVNTNPGERAENEFRRAVNLVNQGRIAEGMDGFRGVLEIDPGHEAARQTLVALALEAKRVDDAAALLEQGLALNAGNSGFAMLLARIKVERGDVPGALSLLQKHAVPSDRNPDFHAFAAALYQRLDRHQEAIEQYRAALSIAPAAGVWWVGLGISYQAAQQPKQALEAFRHAKSAGNLAPELSSFVEQRLKQLQ
jgi:MSHA biogenesis protein MshN